MGRRYLDERLPWWIRFTHTWGNKPGMGRWYKHRLSKARRRYIRDLLRLGKAKEPVGLEREVDWRGW